MRLWHGKLDRDLKLGLRQGIAEGHIVLVIDTSLCGACTLNHARQLGQLIMI